MKTLQNILHFFDTNLIQCLIPMLLALMLVQLIFKKRFETQKALSILRWAIVGYTVVNLLSFILSIDLNSTETVFTRFLSGPYRFIYSIIFFFSYLLPFTLLIKRWASKFWYVILISFGMKLGTYYERFVILTTSIHRDYTQEADNYDYLYSFASEILLITIQGIVLSFVLLTAFELQKRRTVPTQS